ncbi:MAG TPA: hypothetical protein VGG90_10415 [Candidatus Dormibacteraeota bacterium]
MSHAIRNGKGARSAQSAHGELTADDAAGAQGEAHEQAQAPAVAPTLSKPFTEGFRLLALDIDHLLQGSPNRSVLVMSALPKEGRTTTAAGLARAFAEVATPVALVDANPAAVIGSAPVAGQPYEVISPWATYDTQAEVVDYVRLVLESGRSAGATVVIDVPPATTSSLGFFLAPLVGGVLYVMRTRRTPDATFAAAVRSQLDLLGVKVLGVVVNEG